MFENFSNLFDKVGSLDSNLSPNNSRYQNFADIAGVALNFIMGVGFAIGIVAIAYSMVMYILSGGDPEKTKRAWNAFIWGVMGTAIGIATLAFRRIILTGFGVNEPGITTGLPNF